MTKPLSPESISIFERDGLVIADATMPDDYMARLEESVVKLTSDNPNLKPEQLANPHLPTELTDVVGSEDFLTFATHPILLDAVEQLIGPDIILWSTHVFNKPPNEGMGIPWHQDGHAFPIDPIANVTIWLALDDVDAENGCLRYIPGSHIPALIEHDKVQPKDQAFNISINRDNFDESKSKDVILSRGQFSLHHVRVIHGSEPNLSTRRRAGMTFFYFPATSIYDRRVETIDVGLPRPSEHAKRPSIGGTNALFVVTLT